MVAACTGAPPPTAEVVSAGAPRTAEQLEVWRPGHPKDVMEVLGDATAPMFARIPDGALTPEDFAALERGARLVEIATHKLFDFYGYNDAQNMHRVEVAKAVAEAAKRRDAAAARSRLTEMRDDCQACHKERMIRPAGRRHALP